MRCIYCKSQTYLLKNGYRKCKICKKKFSPKKIERKEKILDCFCKNYSANRCAKKLGLNYITIKKEYDNMRKKIALFMEEEFLNKKEIIAFDEYIYFPASKQKDKSFIFDGFNFLTFNFDNKIYNILLPTLRKFKPLLIEDEQYYKEFEKFLLTTHISNSSNNVLIKEFWSYFEEFILKFNGIDASNFIYYLKEAEFKFNYTCSLLQELMTQKRQY